MSNPIVTVWLTSYNQGKYLREAIDSVLGQTFKDFELVICDDCSTDNSWEIIQSYNDSRILKRQHEVNMGYHVTYDIIDKCKGKYFAVHHSDDIWEPDKLEKQVAFMEQNEEYAACFTKVKFIDENSSLWELPEGHIYKNAFEQANRPKEEWIRHFFYKGNCLCHPSLLIRKDKYRQYKLLEDFGLVQFPDYNTWVKLCFHENIYVYPEYLTRFRIRRYAQDNVSADRPEVRIRCQYEFTKIYENLSNIDSKEEMLKIFPETKEYLINGEMNVKYALAQLLFKIPSSSAAFTALNLLYKQLDNAESREQLERLYGFTFKDFKNSTARYDIFCVNRNNRFLNCQLFIATADGRGFNSENCISVSSYVQADNSFFVEFNTSKYGKLKAVRFDPHDEAVKVKLISATANNTEMKVAINNALYGQDEEGYEVFSTNDPIYCFEEINKEVKKVTIKGFVSFLEPSYFGNKLYQLQRDTAQLMEEKNQLLGKIAVEKEKAEMATRNVEELKKMSDILRKEAAEARVIAEQSLKEANQFRGEAKNASCEAKAAMQEADEARQELQAIKASRGYRVLAFLRNLFKRGEKANAIAVKNIAKSVSVIIPTYNAGDTFEELLSLLKNQKGIDYIQLVVVDSGSSDNTVAICKKHNVTLIEIPNSEFSHSGARNMGAEHATGDILLFMTQDARPESDGWMLNLIQDILTKDIAAVSCSEKCPENTELFYCAAAANHAKYLGIYNSERYCSYEASYSAEELRKNGSLNDVTTAVRKDIFLRYKYRYDFAEDLDLGVRLVKDGFKLKLTGKTRTVHGHNRAPGYYFKRGCVETRALQKILAMPQGKAEGRQLAGLAMAGLKLMTIYKQAIERIEVKDVEAFHKEINAVITNKQYLKDIDNLEFDKALFDNVLQELVEGIQANYATVPLLPDGIEEMLAHYYNNVLYGFIKEANLVYTDQLKQEAADCLLKQFALVLGSKFAELSVEDKLYEDLCRLVKGV